MCFLCDLANAELVADLFIHSTGDDQRHDLRLATGKRCVTVPDLLLLRFVAESGPSECELASVPQYAERGDHLLTDISDTLRVRGAVDLEGLL